MLWAWKMNNIDICIEQFRPSSNLVSFFRLGEQDRYTNNKLGILNFSSPIFKHIHFHQFFTNIHMKRFHTKWRHNWMIDPDLRTN